MVIKRVEEKLRHGTEIWCRGTEHTMLKKIKNSIERNKFNPISISWEFQCQWQKSSGVCVRRHKNGLPITRETIQIKGLEIAEEDHEANSFSNDESVYSD
jgi:hypothetical protein